MGNDVWRRIIHIFYQVLDFVKWTRCAYRSRYQFQNPKKKKKPQKKKKKKIDFSFRNKTARLEYVYCSIFLLIPFSGLEPKPNQTIQTIQQ